VLVKQLEERDRRRMLKHFLALDDSRPLTALRHRAAGRAGRTPMSASIDFAATSCSASTTACSSWSASATWRSHPKGSAPGQHPLHRQGKGGRIRRVGVEVGARAGRRLALFERAAIHCRNSDVDTLYMQCLSSNRTMMHIAKKAGMEIQREYGEADAYLRLPPPNPASMLPRRWKSRSPRSTTPQGNKPAPR
jgi:hypothetical protein